MIYKRKESIIILLLSSVLVVIVLLIAWLSYVASTTETPSTFPSPIPTQTSSPTSVIIEEKVRFDPQSEKKLLDKLNNRSPLSTDDASAKAKILSLLPAGETSGVLYRSDNIIIDYTEPVDEFQAEILTINLNNAKAEAVSFFKANGMSQQGICDLPLNFYPGHNVGRYLMQRGVTFYSLPEGC